MSESIIPGLRYSAQFKVGSSHRTPLNDPSLLPPTSAQSGGTRSESNVVDLYEDEGGLDINSVNFPLLLTSTRRPSRATFRVS